MPRSQHGKNEFLSALPNVPFRPAQVDLTLFCGLPVDDLPQNLEPRVVTFDSTLPFLSRGSHIAVPCDQAESPDIRPTAGWKQGSATDLFGWVAQQGNRMFKWLESRAKCLRGCSDSSRRAGACLSRCR